jgi:hypothetical protein
MNFDPYFTTTTMYLLKSWAQARQKDERGWFCKRPAGNNIYKGL